MGLLNIKDIFKFGPCGPLGIWTILSQLANFGHFELLMAYWRFQVWVIWAILDFDHSVILKICTLFVQLSCFTTIF